MRRGVSAAAGFGCIGPIVLEDDSFSSPFEAEQVRTHQIGILLRNDLRARYSRKNQREYYFRYGAHVGIYKDATANVARV